MGFSPWPVQGFYLTYQCDRVAKCKIMSFSSDRVIIPTFCSMSAIKWCVHGASTHTHTSGECCVCLQFKSRASSLKCLGLVLCVFICVCVFTKCLGLCPRYFLGFTQALFHKRKTCLIFLLAKISPIHSLVLTSTLQMSKWRGIAATCIRIHPYPLTAVTHTCVYTA